MKAGAIISIISAIILVGIGSFTVGMWATHKTWAPYTALLMVRDNFRSYRATGMFLQPGVWARRTRGVPPDRYTVELPDEVTPGYLIVNRVQLPEFIYVADLIDENGDVLHTWPIDHGRLFGDASVHKEHEFVHVTKPLPDGTILANFDDSFGLARVDACGDPVWARNVDDMVYHHSIRPDNKEGFWTWEAQYFDGGHDHRMVRFDENTGEILESIDLVSDVMSIRPENELALVLPEGFKIRRDLRKDDLRDILHPNDVTPLPAEYADAYPMFDEGDLLVSLRNINFVAVIDRETHDILWYRHGPWDRQHDPDWHANGKITVYSNNTHRFRSTIVEIDPVTGESHDRFRGTELDFDSYIMGQHQQLPSGNWLIASPTEGRVIEVTSDGRMVRNLNNWLDDRHNATVTYAEWVPKDYFTTLPSCDR
ncbi:MAG: arylsulfotransferase family protein [Marinibacterium sp.]